MINILTIAASHYQAGHLDQAEKLYHQALELEPDNADVLHLLGLIAYKRGKNDLAVKLIKKAVKLANAPNFYNNLGNVYVNQKKFQAACKCYKDALSLKPDYAEAHYNLANALINCEKFQSAQKHYKQALHFKADYAEAHYNLANALMNKGKLESASNHYKKTLYLKPDFADAHNNLGVALSRQFKFKEACKHYKESLRLRPNYAGAYNNFGVALDAQGRSDQAVNYYKTAVELDPCFMETQSNFLFCLNYLPEYTAEVIFNKHCEWGKKQIDLNDNISSFHANLPLPDRPLRIGYVSPDFRNHPVAYFFEPILVNHDPLNIETVLYSEVSKPDAVTQRFKSLANVWRNTCNITDEELIKQIIADGIDILVDLAGHTSNNRLLVFTKKSAPLQLSYLGYPGTTGLDTIDYRITDAVADPPGKTEKYHTEKLIRLPDSFFCYKPPDENIEIFDLPALKKGHITFGAFHNFAKCTHALELWVEILNKLPDSQLIIQSKPFVEKEMRKQIHNFFAEQNISEDRVELAAYAPFSEYLKLHNKVDIILDTFPWNGHTTSCHSLWMGVPVITLAGDCHAGRLCLSLLSSLGLQEWAAYSTEDYVQKAIQFGSDFKKLSDLRQNLRNRLINSPLCDAKKFTRDLESIYRRIWKKWCKKEHIKNNVRNTENNLSLKDAIKHHRAGQLKEAENLCLDILKNQPDNLDALHLIGVIARRFGKFENSINYLNKAIKINSNIAAIHLNIGLALSESGRINEAVESYKRAVNLDPNFVEAIYNLGAALQSQAKFDEAVIYYKKLVSIKPDYLLAWYHMGIALQELDRLDEAIDAYKQAVSIKPDNFKVYYNMGIAMQKQGRFDEAASCYKMVVSIKPDFAQAFYNMGVALSNNASFDKAIECYEQAVSIKPDFVDAQYNLGTALLRVGDLKKGFEKYEWRLKKEGAEKRNFLKPIWDGSEFKGKILLVYTEQGFGDAIQFIRYINKLKKLGGTLLIECHSSLVRLFSSIINKKCIVVRGSEVPEFDMHIPLMSLPHLFKTELNSIPKDSPYLYPPEDADNEILNIIKAYDNKTKVGFVWSGNPKHGHDSKRSCDLFYFKPLFELSDFIFFSLQKVGIKANFPVIDLSELLHDFADTASVISNLDLIITVDTATAHLAGALAKPVWVLLPFKSDWRWLLNRKGSPWYPSMKLFQQSKSGDWTNVISRISKDLKQFLHDFQDERIAKSELYNENKETVLQKYSDKKNQVKTIVHGIGYFSGFTGYNIHTSNFFSELGKLISVFSTDLRFPTSFEKAKNLLNKNLKKLNQDDNIINIVIANGSRMKLLHNCPGRKIGYTVWESTKIPDGWTAPLHKLDEIWLPSKWGKDIFIKHGFDKEKIKVVPEGVDPLIFNPDRKTRQEILNIPGFKFLNIGKYEERKNTKELITAFDEEFKNAPDVKLILSCHNSLIQGFDIKKEINKFNLTHPEKIITVDPVREHSDFASFYTSCDAFVFPTRAEAWGLPIIEAMACGLPVIVTNYSGQTEYVNENNAYLLDFTLEDIKRPCILSKHETYGQWARPDINHLKYLMRYVYEHQNEAMEKGSYASQDVLINWTWKKAAEIALDAFL
ncbi:protein O-GlcNAc transferase [Candidatus Magnetomoraceae bacterium gMMP-15]